MTTVNTQCNKTAEGGGGQWCGMAWHLRDTLSSRGISYLRRYNIVYGKSDLIGGCFKATLTGLS